MTMQQQSLTYLKNPYVFNSFPIGQDNRYMGQLVLSKLNDNFLQKSENKINTKRNYQNNNLNNQSINQLPNQSKVSYSRNSKQSQPQSNQSPQIKKQKQRQHYRKQLQTQIKADKQRKQQQKQKKQRQQLERQRKFYAEIKSKQKKSKVQQSHIILRSAQGKRKNKQSMIIEGNQSKVNSKSLLERTEEPSPNNVAEYPNIIKRGGYNNHSVLDNYHLSKSSHQQRNNYASNKKQPVQNNYSSINSSPIKSPQMTERNGQVYMVQVINPEEERIRSIIKMQEKMLKKLDNVKEQINKINKNFDLQKEVKHIRNILRSKPIKLDPWNTRNQHFFSNYNDFYRFPKFESQTLTRNSNRSKRSRLHSVINMNQQNGQPQRTLTEQNPKKKLQHSNITINQKSSQRKREPKTQNRSNDNNYANSTEQNEENDDEIRLPVVLQQNN